MTHADTMLTPLRSAASVGGVTDRDGPAENRIALLTRRQRQVLTLMAQGLSNAAIAQALFITEKSVGEHASNVYDTLGLLPSDGAHRRVLAVLRFLACHPSSHTHEATDETSCPGRARHDA